MPRIVDCAFAIHKDSLANTGGLIRKALRGEKSSEVYRTALAKNDDDRFLFYRKTEYNSVTDKWVVKNAKKEIVCTPRDESEARRIIRDKNYDGYMCVQQEYMVANTMVVNGWMFNLKKLKMWLAIGGEYPRIEEYDDHITMFFQSDYEFPCGLKDKMEQIDAKWSGINTMYNRSFSFGNADLGLRAVSTKTNEIDGYGDNVLSMVIKDITRGE